MDKLIQPQALTFDDVLIVPARSEVLPREVDTHARLTRNINLNIPLVSAAMDTVTESRMAIAIAREGAIGIIHKNLTIDAQAREVDRVKRSESAIIENPVTLESTQRLRDALRMMRESGVSGFPIVDDGVLVGILTHRDVRFEDNLDQKISKVMTKKVVTAPEGTTLENARDILQKHRIEKLPITDEHGVVKGLITVKDIQKRMQFPHACKDDRGRLRVGAAVGATKDAIARVTALVDANVDVIVVDSAHGHSIGILRTVESLRNAFPELQIIAGNIVTASAAHDLIAAGADAVKVGVGPGSICTTRIVAGVGVPQVTAILNCAEEADKHGVPVIADGGIKYSGDIAKALVAGASTVMIGSLFAGMEESPGEKVLYEGRTFKTFYGMGSLAAMKKGSKDRYFQEDEHDPGKLVPEGIEGRVPYTGPLADSIFQMVGGLKAAMGYCGCKDIATFRESAQLVTISNAGLKESHPHGIMITKEAPNYRLR